MTTFDLHRFFVDIDGEVADAQAWLRTITPDVGDTLTIVHGDGERRVFRVQCDEHGDLVLVEQDGTQ